jgi:hypothetical protein
MTTVSVPLDAEARLELASMAYSRWCKAYDEMKGLKASTWESQGKFCPKDEWPDYHRDQLTHAANELAKATRLKDAICPHSPIIAGG